MRIPFRMMFRELFKRQQPKYKYLILISAISFKLYNSPKSWLQEISNQQQQQQQSSGHIDEFLEELRQSFKDEYVDPEQSIDKLVTAQNQSEGELQTYSKDSHSYHETHSPICILYATSTADVQKYLKICNKYSISVVPYCQGTSLEGGVLPMSKQSAIINFIYMNKILLLHEKDLQVEVEPGVSWMDLNKYLADYKLFFPIDPGPGAGIGGMVGTNCSGTNAVRYGSMRDWVVNLEVVLSDGRTIQTAQRAKKSSAGYNLTQLIVGSEGTLGLVTKITLKVTHLPRINSIVTASFQALDQLGESVHQIIKNEIPLACVELMDRAMVNLILQNQPNDKVNGRTLLKDQNLLMMKIQGDPDAAEKQLNIINKIILAHDGQNIQQSSDLQEIDRLWNIRKIALYMVQQYAKDIKGINGQVWTTDVCVPISQLSKNIQETQQEIDQNHITGPIVGHVGDGNYHVIFVVDYSNLEQLKLIQKINHNMVLRAIEAQGTCTGEHGIGIGKREFLLKEKGELGVELMRNIKKVFDPKGILNPGKIFI